MGIRFNAAAGTTLQLKDGQHVTLPVAAWLEFAGLTLVAQVQQVLAGDSVANFALNKANFPPTVDVNGTSFAATLGPNANVEVGAEVGPTPEIVAGSSSWATDTVTLTFTEAMDESVTDPAGIFIYGDDVLLAIDTLSISSTVATITLSASFGGTDLTVLYSPGGLLSDAGAAVLPILTPLLIAPD